MPAKNAVAEDPLYGSVTPLPPSGDPIKDDIEASVAERLDEEERFDLRAAARRHAKLLFGLGALAVVGVAAVVGRRPLALAARTAVKRVARPAIAQAVLRRPLQTARLAAHRPKLAARVASALR